MSKNTTVEVSLKEYSLETVRYAAHSLGGSAYVLLKPLPGRRVLAEFAPKPGAAPVPAAAFRAALKDEALRERIDADSRELREYMLLKALTWRPRPPEREDSGLTPQQEKELNDLIAQIEGEIKAEAAGAKSADPLGITSTWEEKHEKKSSRKKR